MYITSTEARTGKSAVSLGVMEQIFRDTTNVAFFRPIIQHPSVHGSKQDKDISLIMSYYNIKMAYEDTYAYTFDEANELIVMGRQEELLDGIMSKYKELESRHEFVLLEGTDYEGVTSAFEFDINADIANNLGSPVLIVNNARHKSIEEVVSSANMAIDNFKEKGCTILGLVVNRVLEENLEKIRLRLQKEAVSRDLMIMSLPEISTLSKPTMNEVQNCLNAEVLYGKDNLHKHAEDFIIAAMQFRNFLEHLKDGTCVVAPGDRADILVGSLLSLVSTKLPKISGIVLTGGLRPEPTVSKLIEGLTDIPVTVLLAKEDTYTTALKLHNIHAAINPENRLKIATALGMFETNVNTVELRKRISISRSERITPKMFEYGLIQKAKSNLQHIVLPEGEEERILSAAEILLKRGVVEITLLGHPRIIEEKMSKLGINLHGANIVNPVESPLYEDYVQTYFELRKHKGIQMDAARDTMADVNYFGTMMIYKGHADGMVSGSINTTAQTIRPSFEIVKTKPGCSIVSSVFFMCLEDRVLVYGDCAVNPKPNAEQLAEIAISSAETAQIFGVEPRVAMLSYSTGASGKGADVELVAKATSIAQERKPEYKIEGPLQYDAAVDPNVAKTKLPNSEVAGKATVFIFPDLNTGNNTYKAVQRSAHAVAVGPVLQGLNKPVNDLSRGCTVADIVNTVAITAIQAQAEKGIQ